MKLTRAAPAATAAIRPIKSNKSSNLVANLRKEVSQEELLCTMLWVSYRNKATKETGVGCVIDAKVVALFSVLGSIEFEESCSMVLSTCFDFSRWNDLAFSKSPVGDMIVMKQDIAV